MSASKKPTGLSITRNGNTFNCSWKIGDADYGGGQQFYYDIGSTWMHVGSSADIGKKTTSKSFTVNLDNYGMQSYQLVGISFHVRGNRKKYKKTEGKGKNKKEVTVNPGWSDYSSKTFNIDPPYTPTISAEADSTHTNKTTFSISCTKKSDDHKHLSKLEYKTALVEGCNYYDGSKAPYGASTQVSGTTSGDTVSTSVVITEDSSIINSGKSYTRWVAVRSRGAGGDSPWVYASHTYALANKAQNVRASAEENSSGFVVTVSMNTSSTRANPIDVITTQYTICAPDDGLTCPSGASWSDGPSINYKDGSDTVRFSIDDKPSRDECLFIRVNTKHDSFTTYGNAVLTYAGGLKPPSIVDITPSIDANTVTVEVAHNTSVTDSFVAVRYIPNSTPDKAVIVAVIPFTETTVVGVKCPDWSDEETFTFDIFSMCGSYERMDYATGVYCYQVNDYFADKPMRSTMVRWANGDVPKPPSGVKVEPTSITGTARISWSFKWDSATGAEIAWADHDDAWESTDEPNTYVISNNRAVKWNVSGLDTGKEWFFRVRLIKEGKDNTIYSQWSDMVSLILYGVAPTPTLNLSSSVISTDESVVASWSYASIDGSNQLYAEICDIANVNNIDIEFVATKETTFRKRDFYVRSGSGTSQSPYVYKVKDLKTYTATSDTTAQAGKVYYARSGSGTAADPYVYTKVENASGSVTSYYELTNENPTVNPYSQGLYEINRRIIATVSEEQHVTLKVSEVDWRAGETHYLAVRVVSASGKESPEWSAAKPLIVTTPITCTIASTSLTTVTVPKDDDDETTRTALSLTELPLTLTVTGAGTDGITSVVIERAESYHMERPDEDSFNGFEGEAIVVIPNHVGESQITITADNMIGSFDDGAKYRIIANVKNGYGQKASADPLDFEVHWSHQALIPSASVSVDDDMHVAFITPYAPSGAVSTDKADIYRLSTDKPQLIYKGASFGETYVDPYPALGEFGGHRVVFVTANGDYITEDNEIAWCDLDGSDGDEIDLDNAIITFGNNEIILSHNIDLSNAWEKDFQETKYLGGSIQGDWNAGVGRKLTLSAVAISIREQETLELMRRLAVYTGICNVRTPDGSSFNANVTAKEERSHSTGRNIVTFSLEITRVDPERLDGMTYQDWAEGVQREYVYSIINGNLYETAETASGNTFDINERGELIWSPSSTVDEVSFSLKDGELEVNYGG